MIPSKNSFQTSNALSISLKAFCMLVTSYCSLHAYFGAQRLLIGSRLWFSDTQHFTCTLLAFFIKQHFFCLFVLVFLSQGFLISTDVLNFIQRNDSRDKISKMLCYVVSNNILWNTNNSILNMNSLFPFCPLHTAQLQYQSSFGVRWSCHLGFDQLNRNKYNMCYFQISS